MSNEPAEDQMRQQMYKTLGALERMADAVTDYLTTDAVTDYPVADKKPAEEPEVTDPAASQVELDEMGKVVAKHHRALALLATFGMMKDKPMRGADPAKEIASLLGMAACRNCVGTGWVARDETCGECNKAGFLKA